MKVASLFCGCGGLDLGLEKSGFDIVWVNDFDKDSIDTYKRNFNTKKTIITCGDIKSVETNTIPEVDLVVGGFPCQGFSMANPYRNTKDERNTLYLELLRVVKDKRPKIFLGENVSGITNLGGYDNDIDKKNKTGRIFKMILKDFDEMGYRINWKILNAADYGVPQLRKRMIMVGIRKDITGIDFEFPKPLYQKEEYKTVKAAIGDLPLAYTDKIPNHHGTKHKVKINGYMGNRHTDQDKPSPTIVGRGGGTGGPVIIPHPSRKRRMTVRETARIQTFPDNFIFEGSISSQYRQIGNAVPVELARILGESIKKVLKKIDKKK